MPLPGVNRKRKGTRVEREIVKDLESIGIDAKRQYASGAFGTSINEKAFQGDVRFKIGRESFRIEAKARANGGGFAQLDKWKGDNDFLFLKQDRSQPRVYCEWEAFLRLLQLAMEGTG